MKRKCYAEIDILNPSMVQVVEWTTLVAMAVYALVAWGIVHLFQLVKPTTPQEVEENV